MSASFGDSRDLESPGGRGGGGVIATTKKSVVSQQIFVQKVLSQKQKERAEILSREISDPQNSILVPEF